MARPFFVTGKKSSMNDEPESQRTMQEILGEIRRKFAEDESYFEPGLGTSGEEVTLNPVGYSPRADLEEQCEDEEE
jgi:hypothetical protein